MNNFVDFIKRNMGAIVGVIIGIVFVVVGLSHFILNLIIMIGFGVFGMYFQKNKESIKEKLKMWIDKI